MTDEKIKNLKTNLFLSHLRYKTSGGKNNKKIQPIISKNKFGYFSFAFNGNIPKKYYNLDYKDIKIDTDLFLKYFEEAIDVEDWDSLLKNFLNRFERSYSLIVITENNIYFIKDRYAVRPFSYIINENQIEACSETCGLTTNNSIEVENGSIVKIFFHKVFTIKKIYQIEQPKAMCLFEMFYFMSPKSTWYNNNIKNKHIAFGCSIWYIFFIVKTL